MKRTNNYKKRQWKMKYVFFLKLKQNLNSYHLFRPCHWNSYLGTKWPRFEAESFSFYMSNLTNQTQNAASSRSSLEDVGFAADFCQYPTTLPNTVIVIECLNATLRVKFLPKVVAFVEYLINLKKGLSGEKDNSIDFNSFVLWLCKNPILDYTKIARGSTA